MVCSFRLELALRWGREPGPTNSNTGALSGTPKLPQAPANEMMEVLPFARLRVSPVASAPQQRSSRLA
eukprot:1092094-Amphidinium_carterae.1